MAFAMGISVEEFKHMTPYKLECCLKGHKINRQMRDEEQYLWWREYGISAFIYAIDHTFAKSPRAEFVKEPILSQIRANRPLTEEEKERELREFIKQNERMRSKWKRKHKKESEHEC